MKDFLAPRQQYIEANGIKHNVLVWNEAGKNTIVCVHGYLTSCYSYAILGSLLSQKYKVVAFDFRGHGQSSWVGAGGYYHFFDYAADIDGLLPQVVSGDLHIVAHSMGGMAMNCYLGAKPEMAKTMTLLEGLGPRGNDFSDAPQRLAKWLHQLRSPRLMAKYETIEEAAERLMQSNPKLSREFALYIAENTTRRTEDGGYCWTFDPLHKTSSPQPFYLEQALQLIGKIRCPVLLLRGSESAYLKYLREFSTRENAFPNGRVEIVEGASHDIHIDKPHELQQLIFDFIEVEG